MATVKQEAQKII